MGPIQKGIDEEDMWTVNYLGFMHCCMEEGWLSDAENEKKKLSQSQIQQCLEVLQQLNADTDQIFEIPKEKRVELIMAAGLFSRPSKEEFKRRKRAAKKAEKQKSCNIF